MRPHHARGGGGRRRGYRRFRLAWEKSQLKSVTGTVDQQREMQSNDPGAAAALAEAFVRPALKTAPDFCDSVAQAEAEGCGKRQRGNVGVSSSSS